MKLGLLGSAETHRGTRWASKWAFAVREAWVGEFEFSEIHREAINHHFKRLRAAVKAIPGVLEAFHLCSIDIQASKKP
ncbi:hypothetical protein E3N88_10144 [Mikania micrantha]|uniref:Uncharacterized protein n=1 Tax=Mikania micrantha TaxID=192012 RepID=A0A5N6P9Z8_9ASTR|nr:hypothetical protein E3N88_10144 [Mikania micrantha]